MKNSSSLKTSFVTVMALVCGLALSACDKGGGGSPAAVGTNQFVGTNGYATGLPYVSVSGIRNGKKIYAYAYQYIAGAQSKDDVCAIATRQNIAPLARVSVTSGDGYYDGRRTRNRRFNSSNWTRWQGNRSSAQSYVNGAMPSGAYVFCFYSQEAFTQSNVRNAFETFYGSVTFTLPVMPGNEYMQVRFDTYGEWMPPMFGSRAYFETYYYN